MVLFLDASYLVVVSLGTVVISSNVVDVSTSMLGSLVLGVLSTLPIEEIIPYS